MADFVLGDRPVAIEVVTHDVTNRGCPALDRFHHGMKIDIALRDLAVDVGVDGEKIAPQELKVLFECLAGMNTQQELRIGSHGWRDRELLRQCRTCTREHEEGGKKAGSDIVKEGHAGSPQRANSHRMYQTQGTTLC